MEPEPTNLYADTIAPVLRTKPDEVFFIRMEAVPEPDSEDYGIEGGGFVNCYLDADDLRAAELQAIAMIQDQGWMPQGIDSWELITAAKANDMPTEEGCPPARELIEEALAEGESCVFFTWPVDADDAGD